MASNKRARDDPKHHCFRRIQTMKIYEYEFYERWGNGAGIVIAESEEHAKEMMMAPYSSDKTVQEVFPLPTFKEIDPNVAQVLDHSWTE